MAVFGSEVEELNKKLAVARRELEDAMAARPAAALRAERGDAKSLGELDRKAEQIKARIENLTDALAAARWQAQVAAEKQFVPAIELRKKVGSKVRQALTTLTTAIGELRASNAVVAAQAKELKIRRVTPSDLLIPILLELAIAYDLDGLTGRIDELNKRERPRETWTEEEWAQELGRLEAGLKIEFPAFAFGFPDFTDEEASLDAALEEFKKRAASKGPRKRSAVAAEQPSGVLGALNAESRRVGGA